MTVAFTVDAYDDLIATDPFVAADAVERASFEGAEDVEVDVDRETLELTVSVPDEETGRRLSDWLAETATACRRDYMPDAGEGADRLHEIVYDELEERTGGDD